jgi:hypothetical protein
MWRRSSQSELATPKRHWKAMDMVLHLESGYGRVAQVVKVSGNIGRSEAKTEVTKVIFAYIRNNGKAARHKHLRRFNGSIPQFWPFSTGL